MNIIEHVWGRMKEEAWKTKPKNLDELGDCKTAFFAIPDDINKLYESLPNRMVNYFYKKNKNYLKY